MPNVRTARTRSLIAVAALAALTASGRAADATPSPLSPESRAVYEKQVVPFLKQHCYKCHDESSAEAGFQVDALGADFLAGKTADHWREVMDKLNLGKMPPKKQARPDPKEAFAVVEWINGELRAAEKRAKSGTGRAAMRRLNRTEYANTVRDLFGLDENFARRVEDELPMDGKVEGFDRGGASLFVDESLLTRYLEVADLVLGRGVFAPAPTVKKLDFRPALDATDHAHWVDEKTGRHEERNLSPAAIHALKNGELFRIPLNDTEIEKDRTYRYVPYGKRFWEVKEGGAVEYVSGDPNYRPPFYYQVHCNHDWARAVVTTDGWYSLKVKAGAFKGEGAEALDEVRLLFEYGNGSPVALSRTMVIDAPLDGPKEYEFRVYLRRGSPELRPSFDLTWNCKGDVIEHDPDYNKAEWKPIGLADQVQRAVAAKKSAEEVAKLRAEREEAVAAYRKLRETFAGPMLVYNKKYDLAKMPRLRIESMRFEGPLVEYPPKGRADLFFAGEGRADDAYLREIFERFLPRAYRRPVTPAEVDAVAAYARTARDKYKLSFPDTVREGLKLVLCSPDFLYLEEPSGDRAGPRELNGYEFAARLSYFLWSAPPDRELTDLAAAGKLNDRAVVTAQVKRMLADPRAGGFVENFAGQWLKVREFKSVSTDRDRFRQYDDDLQDSGRREPLEFAAELLRGDRSVLNFLDSDFLVVNDRLARHYGIPDVKGPEFRVVPAPAGGRRGGVLGMAGVLTYLSDGQRTLPVRRAAYVLDTFYNAPPPLPPPNVGDLPVVKGKNLTVRQRLDQHRASASCASCHDKIDAFGIALENYDAIGAWRDRQTGEGFQGDPNAPFVDVSGTLPDGREFKTLPEFKAALLADKDRFGRGLTEKLLTYALGRPVGATDRETVEQVQDALKQNDYRIQALIQAVVATPAFHTK